MRSYSNPENGGQINDNINYSEKRPTMLPENLSLSNYDMDSFLGQFPSDNNMQLPHSTYEQHLQGEQQNPTNPNYFPPEFDENKVDWKQEKPKPDAPSFADNNSFDNVNSSKLTNPSPVQPNIVKSESEPANSKQNEVVEATSVEKAKENVAHESGTPESGGSTSAPKSKKQRLTADQLAYLLREFSKDTNPPPAIREKIGRELNIPERSVTIWFQNRRAKSKLISRRQEEERQRILREQRELDSLNQKVSQAFAHEVLSTSPTSPYVGGIAANRQYANTLLPKPTRKTGNFYMKSGPMQSSMEPCIAESDIPIRQSLSSTYYNSLSPNAVPVSSQRKYSASSYSAIPNAMSVSNQAFDVEPPPSSYATPLTGIRMPQPESGLYSYPREVSPSSGGYRMFGHSKPSSYKASGPVRPPNMATGHMRTSSEPTSYNSEFYYFSCTLLVIGLWKRLRASPQDLMCFYSPPKKLFAYLIQFQGIQYRIEYSFFVIESIHVFRVEEPLLNELSATASNRDKPAPNEYWLQMDIQLSVPPVFHMITSEGQGNCTDFTEGNQASEVLLHSLMGRATSMFQMLDRVRRASPELGSVIRLQKGLNPHQFLDPQWANQLPRQPDSSVFDHQGRNPPIQGLSHDTSSEYGNKSQFKRLRSTSTPARQDLAQHLLPPKTSTEGLMHAQSVSPITQAMKSANVLEGSSTRLNSYEPSVSSAYPHHNLALNLDNTQFGELGTSNISYPLSAPSDVGSLPRASNSPSRPVMHPNTQSINTEIKDMAAQFPNSQTGGLTPNSWSMNTNVSVPFTTQNREFGGIGSSSISTTMNAPSQQLSQVPFGDVSLATENSVPSYGFEVPSEESVYAQARTNSSGSAGVAPRLFIQTPSIPLASSAGQDSNLIEKSSSGGVYASQPGASGYLSHDQSGSSFEDVYSPSAGIDFQKLRGQQFSPDMQ